MNLRDTYASFGEDGQAGAKARQLLGQQHWFASLAEFDPRTGEALPLRLGQVLDRLASRDVVGYSRDRLWRLVKHSRASVKGILAALSEDPRREHALLPIRDVKELDATSFIALSRRPGRNIREKLAGQPYMQAVRRYQSVDLPQNRLLKEYLTQVADLLELRRRFLGSHEDAAIQEITTDIHRWLRTAEAQSISRWDNLPPNNTLLAHRDYRRVWDSWRWLQSLDEDMNRDFERIGDRADTIDEWRELGEAYSEGVTLWGDMPVLFDYDTFTVKPWSRPLARKSTSPRRLHTTAKTSCVDPVCVDLTYIRPRYATTADYVARSLPETFLWQHWANGHDAVDLELFDSDAVYLNDEATTLTSTHLFLAHLFEADCEALLQSAAHSFARKLSSVFMSPHLLWLIPDTLNDFELQVARSNINSWFAHAVPLPRSVAAVFEHVDPARIPGPGYETVIVDSFDGTTYATKLVTGHDPELERRAPMTRGFYWERMPHARIDDTSAPVGPAGEIPYFGADGEFFPAVTPTALSPVDKAVLRSHPDIGSFDICITLSASPVVGGVRLHDLQDLAGSIPLWRDRIPELSIKAIKSGRYRPFYLVDRDTTIRPLRGKAVPIPVNDRFTLPAGQTYYQFPLFRGKDPNDLGYVAKLESPSFPLSTDTTCQLAMTYTYGADDPYQLIFVPLDGSFAPVQVTWRPKTESVVTDAPAPGYPHPLSWIDLRTWIDAQGKEVDLLAWLEDSLSQLVQRIPLHTQVTISQPWRSKTDNRGESYWYAFATKDDGEECYCNTKTLAFHIDGDPNVDIPVGSTLYAEVRQTPRGASAFDLSRHPDFHSDATKNKLLNFRERSLQNRFATIWGDSRSLTDPDCPNAFATGVKAHLHALSQQLPEELIERKLMPLLAFMHKDAPPMCVEWIIGQVEGRAIRNPRAIGSSLGNLELPWQRAAFDELLTSHSKGAIASLSYAVWRDSRFVSNLTLNELSLVLEHLRRILRHIEPVRRSTQSKDDRRKWARSVGEPLELLLGVLRTRNSSNSEIRMLLQPHQNLTKYLAADVERIAEIVAESGVNISSRVELSDLPPRANGDSTPEIIYALRLYLTGDAGAGAIRVIGVNDGEEYYK